MELPRCSSRSSSSLLCGRCLSSCICCGSCTRISVWMAVILRPVAITAKLVREPREDALRRDRLPIGMCTTRGRGRKDAARSNGITPTHGVCFSQISREEHDSSQPFERSTTCSPGRAATCNKCGATASSDGKDLFIVPQKAVQPRLFRGLSVMKQTDQRVSRIWSSAVCILQQFVVQWLARYAIGASEHKAVLSDRFYIIIRNLSVRSYKSVIVILHIIRSHTIAAPRLFPCRKS